MAMENACNSLHKVFITFDNDAVSHIMKYVWQSSQLTGLKPQSLTHPHTGGTTGHG